MWLVVIEKSQIQLLFYKMFHFLNLMSMCLTLTTVGFHPFKICNQNFYLLWSGIKSWYFQCKFSSNKSRSFSQLKLYPVSSNVLDKIFSKFFFDSISHVPHHAIGILVCTFLEKIPFSPKTYEQNNKSNLQSSCSGFLIN